MNDLFRVIDSVEDLEVEEQATPYPRVEQYGPLRHVDKEMRCMHSEVGKLTTRRFNCHSPTQLKFQGVPTCAQHALRAMNKMLFELGVEK